MWKRRQIILLVVAVLVAVPILFVSLGFRRWSRSRTAVEQLPRATARRTDLHVTLAAGGRVEASRFTLIECELEPLRMGELNIGGSSTIIELIPEGSTVQRDEVLCRFDATDYEEAVRQQRIKVEAARADRLKAELDLKAAQLALDEYRDGLLVQLRQDYQGRLALAESDLRRQIDRLEWAQRMATRGYIALGQVITETQNLKRLQLSLEQTRRAATNLERFGVPINLRQLEGRVEAAKAMLHYQTARLERTEALLQHYEQQVELCTVRAPHDGFVIYANEPDHDPRVELGAQAKRKMDLFYLPDLSSLEVQALLHETVVSRVRAGMPALIKVEALPNIMIEGQIASIATLPLLSTSRTRGDEVKNYLGRIRLHNIPRGLLPGMTAEVEIVAAQRPSALVIPARALAYEDGREFCYVTHPEGLERRAIQIGHIAGDLLEVTEGLDEGEQVVLDPERMENPPPLIAESALSPEDEAPSIGQ
ncbi:MAG: efflux RND transporter periplasmic adaptor subunit [Isosphaeraceae bacterium]|nr:efflux RND transporter periplasmic adaptor subunit [Isosphaeraceae bacterium]